MALASCWCSATWCGCPSPTPPQRATWQRTRWTCRQPAWRPCWPSSCWDTISSGQARLQAAGRGRQPPAVGAWRALCGAGLPAFLQPPPHPRARQDAAALGHLAGFPLRLRFLCRCSVCRNPLHTTQGGQWPEGHVPAQPAGRQRPPPEDDAHRAGHAANHQVSLYPLTSAHSRMTRALPTATLWLRRRGGPACHAHVV